MSQTPIELKGSSFTLSVVHLHHPEPEVVRQALQDKVNQAPHFLKNAPVVLNVSSLKTGTDWHKMQQAVASTGLRIVGISGCNDDRLKHMITLAGLPLMSEGKRSALSGKAPSAPSKPIPAAAKTIIVTTPVRSGQQIYAPQGDLIVISSVSAGAELIADGHIHIYGTMRGRALAGASGCQQSQIFCSHLAAELVSVAGEYWTMEQIPAQFLRKPSRLCLSNGVLTIQELS